jgi:hypothetical protein
MEAYRNMALSCRSTESFFSYMQILPQPPAAPFSRIDSFGMMVVIRNWGLRS